MDLSKARNRLVARLDVPSRRRLEPHFEACDLAFKQTLYDQGKPVDYVYFPETGVVSTVTALDNGEMVETGTVGNEGFAGLPAVLGVARSASRVFCQIPGDASRVPASVIAEERGRSSAWFALLLRYVHFSNAMTAQGAACNRMHAVDARLGRWLLMTHDRVERDDFPLTQEFLAMMLGVARPTVNIAGATLQKAGFIQYSRGRIRVLDRVGLESAACECYKRIQQELQSSLNGPPAPQARKAKRSSRRQLNRPD